ncbi:MAG: hypothetical protein IKH60_03900 [Bacteroidales bacterium]|nr:hypothetical protein [Bacteroidales bacterium]
MHKFLVFAASLLLLASCGGKTADPVHEAIKGEILGNMDRQFSDVSINKVEKIDSTTFRTELERRKKVFMTKRDADSELLIKYMTEGKRRNAEIKSESYRKDLLILNGLDSLESAIAGILDDIAYYDYRFSADAKGQDVNMQFRDAYISITPDGRVISMTADRRDLHKSAGRVIPGYYELVKGAGEDEEESEVIL